MARLACTALLAVALTACATSAHQLPEGDPAGPSCKVHPVTPYSPGDAPVRAAFCPGTALTLVVDRAYTDLCGSETADWAVEQWASWGHLLTVEAGYVPAGGPRAGHVYLRLAGYPSDEPAAVELDLVNGLEVRSATIMANNCNGCSLARAIGSALGFGPAARGGDALMSTAQRDGCSMTESELAAMEASR
jgi:hypothetical protein